MRLERSTGALFDQQGRQFDPASRRWQPSKTPSRGEIVDLVEALRWLQQESGYPWRAPLGLIGPRQPSEQQIVVAESVGAGVARLGLSLLCGGREGVMEAACRGANQAGGLTIGLLPDNHWDTANPYVSVPIASGIGVARNAIIARASFCLVAVGGGYGTLSEMAFGLQFDRPVFALEGAPSVDGAVLVRDWADLQTAICREILALP